jgi:hypothetical protein
VPRSRDGILCLYLLSLATMKHKAGARHLQRSITL